MFKRRDIPPVLLLLLLIILVMLTLSQILVVHNGRYGRNVHNMRKLQLELREMDINLHSLMLQNVPSIELNRRLLQNEINGQRLKNILHEAAHGDGRSEALKEARKNNRKANLRRFHSLRNGNKNAENDTNILTESSLVDQSHHLSVNHPSYVHQSPVESHVDIIPAQPIASNLSNHVISASASIGGPNTSTKYDPIHSSNETPTTTPSFMTNNPDLPHVDDHNEKVMEYCPSVPPGLLGRVFTNVNHTHNVTEAGIVADNPYVNSGGTWQPSDCRARHRVAVIIPYRDREHHLIILLAHLHPMLQRQQLQYTIFVVEQQGMDTFNKARIMNIAFVEALKQFRWQCFVFHDVDLVPEDDRNMYSCPAQPRHMSVAIDEMGYKLAYQELVGGVLNMRTEHFQRVNGYSNLYWGWGAEDDDMAYRIMHVGLKITRPPEIVARYKMIRHAKRKPADWRKRAKLLYTGTRRFQFDGLNSLQYKMVKIRKRPLYTHILVDIGKPPRGF